MTEWSAQWRFEQVGHEKFGSEGSLTVTAPDKRSANAVTKDQAARVLFRYRPERYRDYVRVTKLEALPTRR